VIGCGQNSLAMYCLGVLLSFLGYVTLVEFSSGLAMQIAVSIAVMVAAATLMTRMSQLDRHGPKLF
jgi:hypothetical protein